MITEESNAGIREAAGPGYSSRASVKSVVDRIQGLAGRAVDGGGVVQSAAGADRTDHNYRNLRRN